MGIQADADLASLKGTQGICFPTLGAIGFPNTCSALVESTGTVTARAGVAFDRTLFYLLGGFAWEHERLDDTCIGCNIGGRTIIDRSVTTRDGWTAGGGLEYVFAGNWSAFLQYNYMASARGICNLRQPCRTARRLSPSTFATTSTWSKRASIIGSVGDRLAQKRSRRQPRLLRRMDCRIKLADDKGDLRRAG